MATLTVLGCSGGVGAGLRTTAFLLNQRTLIDAGTGVGDLTLEQMIAIDRVFLTHSHLDHIAMLPLLVDSVGAMRKTPLTVYALPETCRALRQHIFNWVIWPDFTQIPDMLNPFLRLEEIHPGEILQVEPGLTLRVLPAVHTVPAVAFHLDSGDASLVFSGDTTVQDAFWHQVNCIGNLRHLLIETAFSIKERRLAELSKHLSPDLLAGELAKLHVPAQIHITHLKPGESELTMRQAIEHVPQHTLHMLQNSQQLHF
jgi:ribonuclease BN (tRNA processing enzyme)